MTSRSLRTLALVTVVAVIGGWAPLKSEAFNGDRPNVLLIYADDLGYGDVGCYGDELCRIPTPHIDSLAAGGMRFSDAHSSSGVCSPSRYTLLTGRYHWRSRLQRGIVNLWGGPLIDEGRTTLGSLAREAGYRTAAIGKWHLGWEWPLEPGDRAQLGGPKKGAVTTERHLEVWERVFSKRIGGGPTTRGFDYYFGTDVPNWPPFCFMRDDRTVGIPTRFAPDELFRTNQASQQGPALENWTLEPILPTLTDEVVRFIHEAGNDERPFLLYVPLTSPHTPLSVNETFVGSSGLGVYGDFMVETDRMVGRMLDALDEAELVDETLVLFTSDNGFAHYAGREELESQGHFPSAHLRGYKSDVWEGGHRVPFIIRWPGRVPASSESSALVHQADVLATLADIWEAPLAEDAGEDSLSILPLLEGQAESVRSTSVSCSINGTPSFRMGRYKLIPVPGSGGWTKGRVDEPAQLYDLVEDPGETRNLFSSEEGRARTMAEAFELEISRGRSTPGPALSNDVKVVRFPLPDRQ